MANVISPLGVGNSTVLFSDALTHADPPIDLAVYSANWTLQPSSAWQVGAAGARTSSGGNLHGALYTAGTFPPDQWAQCTVGALSVTAAGGLIVRGDATGGGNGYYLQIGQASASYGNITLLNVVNGSFSLIYQNLSGPLLAVGDVFKLSVVGSLIILERNGVVIWQGGNTAHTAGAAGIAGVYSGTNLTTINTWSAGSFTYQAPTPGIVVSPSAVALGTIVANTWKTMTVATDGTGNNGPPPNTTGLLLTWSYSGTPAIAFATRTTGSTDTQLPAVANGITTNTQGIVFTGVSLSGTPPVASFDMCFTAVPTGFTMYPAVFFGPEGNFFTNARVITVPAGDISTTPAMIDLSSLIGTGAVAVIADLWGNGCRIAPHGDADIKNWLPSGLTQQSLISGVTSGQIDVTAASGTTPLLYVRGYLTRGFAWRTPAFNVTPTTAAAWVWLAAAPSYPAGTPSVLLYQARSPSTYYTLSGGYSRTTPGWSPAQSAQSQDSLAVTAAPIPKANVASLPFSLAEQGYFISASSVVPPPTAIRSLFAIRTTSQT